MQKGVKVLAGITLYNPDVPRLIENINSICGQVDSVICIDNGSNNICQIQEEVQLLDMDIEFIENGENKGVAYALNQMFIYAEKNGFEWVLTLDQDSVCPDNLIYEYGKYLGEEHVGAICPVICDRNYVKVESGENAFDEVEKCITSATLSPVDAWKDVGGFTEELFIDFVDHDFCAKLIKNKYRIIRVNSVQLIHEIGSGKDYCFLGRKITALNHSAFRKYYMVRNWLYYMHVHRDIINVRKEKASYCFFFLKTFIYEDDKWNKLKCMLKGRKAGRLLCRRYDRKSGRF